MVPNLLPTDPLSQVIFVHNYLQLVFQDSGFTIYNPCMLNIAGTPTQFGQGGFADALVGLIGQSLANVTSLGEESLSLIFANGAILSIAREGAGPEAWQYSSIGGPIVVEQNA